MHYRIIAALAFALTSSVSLGAQVVVRIQARDLPLAGVDVSAWNERGRLASARTDGLGVARLLLISPRVAGIFVTARRMGFAPARVALPAGDSLTISLSEIAAPLPLLTVKSFSLKCPVRSDEVAERLWSVAAARYGRGQDSMYFNYAGNRSQERVSAEQRGFGEDSGRFAFGGNTPTVGKPILLNHPAPYAAYERHVSVVGEYRQWRYAPLHGLAAWHFTTAEFVARHAVTVLGRVDDATTIGFCPREKSESEIEGELQIGDDSTFRAARWQFRVSHDDEEAGGEATFGIARVDSVPYLVAVRGSSWRRADRGFFEQERFELRIWRLGRKPSDVFAP